MGAISRGRFIRKWIWRQGTSQMGRAEEVAMISDLNDLIIYSGGNIDTANTPVDGESVNLGAIQAEEERRRAL